MRKISSTLLFVLAFCSFATAQSAFILSQDTVTGFILAPETTAQATNDLTNVSGAPLSIKWRRFEINLTPNCVTQICDPNQCYAPQVNSKTFTLETDSSAHMIADLVSEDGTPGSVIIRLQFTNAAEPADTASAYYFLSIGTSGTTDQASSLRIQLYPNPVAESFSLEHAEAVQTVRLYSASGRQVAEFAASPAQRYSLAGQPAGTYFVALADKNGKVFRALQVVKE